MIGIRLFSQQKNIVNSHTFHEENEQNWSGRKLEKVPAQFLKVQV